MPADKKGIKHPLGININMRCIEMEQFVQIESVLTEININMRCIEMVKHKKAVEHYLD